MTAISFDDLDPDTQAWIRGKYSQAKGKRGEDIAATLLRQRGVLMVEKIATPVRIIGTVKIRGEKYHKIVWGEKVSGDYRGLLPGGRRVLCEAKAPQNNLRWSDFTEHQRQQLTKNAKAGGLSLVAYLSDRGNFLMQWPIPGFRKYTSIAPEKAAGLQWHGIQE